VDSLYNWVVFVHVVAGFAFAMSHGVSAAVAIRLRRERELERVRALLDLSQWSAGGMYGALVILLIAGIAAGFMASLWGRGWIWAAIVLLVVMFVAMYARATRYFGALRQAAGLPYFGAPKGAQPAGPNTAELARLLASPRPIEIAVIGYAGLLAILWLMLLKPF
jgi:MFS family permease